MRVDRAAMDLAEAYRSAGHDVVVVAKRRVYPRALRRHGAQLYAAVVRHHAIYRTLLDRRTSA